MQFKVALARQARFVFVAFLLGALAACETMPSAIGPIDAPAKQEPDPGKEVRLEPVPLVLSPA